MPTILIAGAGKIGAVIAHILASSDDYQVYLADVTLEKAKANIPDATANKVIPVALNIQDFQPAVDFITSKKCDALMSCLPYFCNLAIAELAQATNVHYFDLTEDVQSTALINQLSQTSDKAFVSQCGLAPGLINIIANDLIQHFDTVDTVKLRCGALPISSSSPLQYTLTWSTDGLINEYGNSCLTVENYEPAQVPGLSNLEEIQVDGLSYEAFCTSGGLGSLGETYAGKIKTMNYKSIRYPGHCEKMRFLMRDLKLNDDRDTLKRILENALPGTDQDVVITYVSVYGQRNNRFWKEDHIHKFYPKEINGKFCTGIQLTTACSACAVIDIVLSNSHRFQGHVKQEQFSLHDVTHNRFGKHLGC